MEELIIFLLSLAEVLGLKAKRPASARPAGTSPVAGPPLPAPAPTAAPGVERGRPRQSREGTARRPEAGSPLDAADAAAFRRQTQSLAAAEPRGLDVRLASGTGAAAPTGLFADQDALVRAIILQEALAPPLCRRRGSPPPATDDLRER